MPNQATQAVPLIAATAVVHDVLNPVYGALQALTGAFAVSAVAFASGRW